MDNLKNIHGENNKIIFELSDGTYTEELTDSETELLNRFPLKIRGSRNTVKIKVKERKDIEAFLKKEGLLIAVTGFDNTVDLGLINYGVNPVLNITGLQIHIGGDSDGFSDEPRYASGCCVSVGDDTMFCGVRIYLQDDGSYVKIGKECMFSWGIDVWCTDVHTITDLEGNPLNYGKSIEIGNHVWVGRDVKIGKNTKISDNSIVGWGSIVTKKFDESNVILAGNTARIVKHGINWDPRDLQSYKKYKGI